MSSFNFTQLKGSQRYIFIRINLFWHHRNAVFSAIEYQIKANQSSKNWLKFVRDQKRQKNKQTNKLRSPYDEILDQLYTKCPRAGDVVSSSRSFEYGKKKKKKKTPNKTREYQNCDFCIEKRVAFNWWCLPWINLSEKFKNGTNIFVDQAVFKIIKKKFARIDLKLKNRLAYRNFNAIFAFLRQFALDVYITFQKSIEGFHDAVRTPHALCPGRHVGFFWNNKICFNFVSILFEKIKLTVSERTYIIVPIV